MDRRVQKLPNENNKSYRIRLYKNKDIYGLSNVQIGELCNKAFGVCFDESAHRKKVKNYLEGYDDGYADAKSKCGTSSDLQELIKTKMEVESEKIKLRDERATISKIVRESARKDELYENLLAVAKSQGETRFYPVVKASTSNDEEYSLLIMLSDLHIGQTFYSPFGMFDSDIAKDRLAQYLEAIFKIKKLYHANSCHVVLMGDMISGSLHKSLIATNRENVIEQVMLASEIISTFIWELSKKFNSVFVNSVNGNHSRIDKFKDALKDERLDSLITWYIKAKLSHLPYVVFNDTLDSTLSVEDILGCTYVMVHGDYDSFTKNGISDLVMMLGYKPYACLFAHNHHSAFSDIANIKMVQSGSLPGAGCDYTTEKRITGNPSQTVCVCSKDGIVAHCPIELK